MLSFPVGLRRPARSLSTGRRRLVHGLSYSAPVLGILGAHEMGHYVACRRYDVDATLPFFLPFPSLSGRSAR